MGFVKKYSYYDKYLHSLHNLNREFRIGSWGRNLDRKKKIHNLPSLFRVWVVVAISALIIRTLRMFSSRITCKILLEYEFFRNRSWTEEKLVKLSLRTCKTTNNPFNDSFTLFFAWRKENWMLVISKSFLLSYEKCPKISWINQSN